MVNSESELIELACPDDPVDIAYPPILCGLENQLLAGRYLDDELIERCIELSRISDQRKQPYRAEELPPVLRRYLELCRRGIRNSHMRINGRKLRKYTTAKRDDVIARLLGAAVEKKSRGIRVDPFEGGKPRDVAIHLAAQITGTKPRSVESRWAEINRKKAG